MSLSFTPHAVVFHFNNSIGKITLGLLSIKCVRFSKPRGKSNPSHLIIELTNQAVPLKLEGEEALKDGVQLQRVLARKSRFGFTPHYA